MKRGAIHGDGPSAIDVHVGARLKEARMMRGLTQGALGRSLGVGFQQIQKYESGRNRISAGLLWRAAEALAVDLTFFFSGLSEGLQTPPEETLTKRHAEVLRALERMTPKARSAFASLAVAVVKEAHGG